MYRIMPIIAALTLTLSVQTAHAGPVIAITAIGNLDNSEAGGWNPNPNASPARAFTHTVMFDLDSCALSVTDGLSGQCTRIRDITTGPYLNYDTGWVTPSTLWEPNQVLPTFAKFSISKIGVSASNSFWYQSRPRPEDWPYDLWGGSINISLEGTWDQQINNLSDLIDKKIRVKQMDQGPYWPNASVSGTDYQFTREMDFILETGFEFARISFVPEPSSASLVSLAIAGLAFTRKRKSKY